MSSLPGTKAQASCHRIDLGQRLDQLPPNDSFAQGVHQATRSRINETVAVKHLDAEVVQEQKPVAIKGVSEVYLRPAQNLNGRVSCVCTAPRTP